MVQILKYVLWISDIITKRYKLEGKQLTEKEFLKSLGPVITNSIDWDGYRALRANKKSNLKDLTNPDGDILMLEKVYDKEIEVLNK